IYGNVRVDSVFTDILLKRKGQTFEASRTRIQDALTSVALEETVPNATLSFILKTLYAVSERRYKFGEFFADEELREIMRASILSILDAHHFNQARWGTILFPFLSESVGMRDYLYRATKERIDETPTQRQIRWGAKLIADKYYAQAPRAEVRTVEEN